MRRLAVLGFALGLGAACRVELGPPSRGGECSDRPEGRLWVYTSLYRHVVDDLDRLAKEALPGVEIEWFQSGSEKVASRIDAELEAGETRADVLLTSDPFFFARMKREGRLLPYVSPRALRVDRSLVDPDGAYAASRAATMVIVYNSGRFTAEAVPRSYEAFTEPRLAGRVILGDPLASGTFFTTLAFLVERNGWGYFDRLKSNGVVATGGNSTVIDRVASGERDAGLALLENVLTAKRKGAPVDYVLPAEGAVLIPGPAAILRSTKNPVAAKAFVDLLFSEAGQDAMVRGDMHSPDPSRAPPAGAPPWEEVLRTALPWSERLVADVERSAGTLRATFVDRVQR